MHLAGNVVTFKKFLFCICLSAAFLAFCQPCYASVYRESNNIIPNNLEFEFITQDGFYAYHQNTLMKSGEYTVSVENDKRLGIVLIYDNERLYSEGGNPQTFVIDNDNTDLNIYVYSINEVNPQDIKLMVNEGQLPLPFEPYWSGYKIVYGDIAEDAAANVEPILTVLLPYSMLMVAVLVALYSALRIVRRSVR